MDDRAVSVPPAEAEALRGWVERERATRTIEIGLGYGVSSPSAKDWLPAAAMPLATS